MAHKRKGQLVPTKEWAKHLESWFRLNFWKRERKAEKEMIRKEMEE